MNDWDEDLNGLFSLFHDFIIKEVHQHGDRITLRVSIPWGQMFDTPENDYSITVVLADCSEISCTYWTIKTDMENRSKPVPFRKTDEWRTTDMATISTLGLEVQSHLYTPPASYLLRSNSDRSIHGARIAGGDLRFSALAFKLFDADNKPMELSNLEAWGAAWWKSIRNDQPIHWPRP